MVGWMDRLSIDRDDDGGDREELLAVFGFLDDGKGGSLLCSTLPLSGIVDKPRLKTNDNPNQY
jgi:hypothetical protein